MGLFIRGLRISKAGVAMLECSRRAVLVASVVCAVSLPLPAQHDYPAPEKLGSVDFSNTCAASVQSQFNRSVALLHSFAYADAEKSFRAVLALDPTCVIAHWGIAMSYYHQLWEPPLNAASYAKGAAELAQVAKAQPRSERESGFIAALNCVYSNADKQSLRERMLAYESSMAAVAKANPHDTEVQVFYALALLSTAPPTDKTHANQKKAAAILEPLYAANPQHPGIPHYLIHACDNAEMASQGLRAARDYSKIAPPLRTLCTCHHTSSRAWDYGTRASSPIRPPGGPRANMATWARSCTPWTTSPTRSCSLGVTTMPPEWSRTCAR